MKTRLLVWSVVLLTLSVGCNRSHEPRGAGAAPDAEVAAVDSAQKSLAYAPAEGMTTREAQAEAPSSPVPVPQERKLIREGTATLEVASVETALAKLRELARQAGGYTTAESRSRDQQLVNHGSIQCRIPAGKLDAMADALKSLGTLENLSISASDITEEYFDLEIRLRNQRQLEERLLALLQRPTNKLSDLLEAERELARVRGDIDQMEGRRRFWDNRVALSTLNVSVHEKIPTVGGQQGGAWRMLRDAFGNAADNFVSAIAGIIAVTGGLIPVIAVVLLVGWIVSRWWRRRRASRKP
jgi:hypothetical protein